MHISEGVLSPAVISAGYVLSITGIAAGLKSMKDRDIVKTAVLSSAFFIASLIHVPLGPGNVHLVLNGLAGIILGLGCFPAIFIALLIQALLFQFGGITSLGVNTFNMAMPAFLGYLLFTKVFRGIGVPEAVGGFITGFFAVALSSFFLSLSLFLSGEHYAASAKIIFLAHIPVMFVDGLITATVITFLKKTKPEILCGR
jgi:cobalt/nickel transport system permease protein